MDVLLLTFANSPTHPLPTLAGEDAAIKKTLESRMLRRHFDLFSLSHATLGQVADYLTRYRDQISLFLYSGHAGRDVLLTEDGASHAGGIAHLLGQCKNLKLVILNGCSTVGQVDALHRAGVPLVIGTSAPVGDEIAAKFSERLFQSLGAGLTIGDAFEQAIGEALSRQLLDVDRSAGRKADSKPDEPLWGLKPHPDKPDALGWKLPVQAPVAFPDDFKANELLLEVLYDTFSGANPNLRQLYASGATLEKNFGDIRAAILKALPAPIGERIRKLVAPSSELEGFDKIGVPRLTQLALCYETTLRFLANLLLAQLWENRIANPGEWNLPAQIRANLRELIDAEAGNPAESRYFDMLGKLLDAAEHCCHRPFIAELPALRTDFIDNEDIRNACFFLEKLRLVAQSATPAEVPELCRRAEEDTALILSKLGFLGRYLLATVRSIDVLKYRSKKNTEFEHLLTKWHDAVGSCEQDTLRQSAYMDNRSVVLLLHEDKHRDDYPYLSLAPFIIDINTFIQTADVNSATLYFFARRNPGSGSLLYRFVNKPDEVLLDLDADAQPASALRRNLPKKPNKYQLAKDQFEEFYTTIVNPSNAGAV